MRSVGVLSTVVAIAINLASSGYGQPRVESDYSDSRARSSISATSPLSYDQSTGVLSLPQQVWPLAWGGTGNGLLSNSPDGQVLRVIGNQIVNAPVPQASIQAAFSVYVDYNGTDGPDCGPINKPCRTLTGPDGAHAKILAANDNCVMTCTDGVTNCQRCAGGVNNGLSCNEDRDCQGGVCSYLVCQSTGQPCSKYCSVSDVACVTDDWCPLGETCTRSNPSSPCSASQCGNYARSICPGNSACDIFSSKTYKVNIGPGRYSEWVGHACSGNTSIQCDTDADCGANGQCIDTTVKSVPSPGCIAYSSSGRNLTTIQESSNFATFYFANRRNVILDGVQVTNFGTGDAIRIAGDVKNAIVQNGAAVHWKDGWDFAVVNEGNNTVILDNMWTFGFSGNSSARSVLFEQHPSLVCSNDKTRACLTSSDCQSGGLCTYNRRYSSGGSIEPSYKLRVGGSSDQLVMNSFIQPGVKPVSDDDGGIVFKAVNCGHAFNLGIIGNVISMYTNPSQYNVSTIKTIQSSCNPLSNPLIQNFQRVYMRNNTLAKLGSIPDSPTLYDLFVGNSTTAVLVGNMSYNACRRYIGGNLLYVDDASKTSSTGQRFGGNAVGYLGILDCDAPQTTSLASPQLTLTQASGGSLPTGTYCYAATATNASGETTAGASKCITLSGCGSACAVSISLSQVNGASGYKIYGRPATSGGTYGLLATLSGFSSTSWTDTGSASPGSSPPSVDSTGVPNPIDGELWVARVSGGKETMRLRRNNTTISLSLGQDSATLTSAGRFGVYDLSAVLRGGLLDTASSLRVFSSRSSVELGSELNALLSCSLSSGQCTVANSPTTANSIATKSYVDSTTKTIFAPAGSWSTGSDCSFDVAPASGDSPGYGYISCSQTPGTGNVFSTALAMPNGWDGGSLSVAPLYVHTASSTVNIGWSCKCVANGGSIGSAYGTEVTTSQSSSTAALTQPSFVSITCSGTCSGAHSVFLRGAVKTGSTWSGTDARFVGLEIRYNRSSNTD